MNLRSLLRLQTIFSPTHPLVSEFFDGIKISERRGRQFGIMQPACYSYKRGC